MRILMVSSEMAPIATTGDLGEAVGVLARALVRRGHEVTVVLPEYSVAAHGRRLDPRRSEPLESLGSLGDVPTADGPRRVEAALRRTSERSGLRVVLLRCPPLYDRPGIYGAPDDYPDNPDRFWVLAAGAVAALRRLDWRPEVAHGHDWHAGWLPAILRAQPDFAGVPTIQTCYDLRMSGSAPMEWAARVGVVDRLLEPEGIEYFGGVSFSKVGLRFADVVVMSSPEGTDPPEGLAGVVRARGAAVTRIPRTIDAEALDPARDLGLPARFSADEIEGKQVCKRRLQAATGLEVNAGAVVVLVPRSPVPDIARGGSDPQVQWLPLDGLPRGIRRLAFAGADAALDPSGDPWSRLARSAERYGLVVLTPARGDASPDGYAYDEREPGTLKEAIDRLVAHFCDAQQWRADLRERLARDPEQGVVRYEALYRQVTAASAGPSTPWARPELEERLGALGA